MTAAQTDQLGAIQKLFANGFNVTYRNMGNRNLLVIILGPVSGRMRVWVAPNGQITQSRLETDYATENNSENI